MPSPEHSTTDFHSYCTQRQIFEKETELDRTRRRAKQYIQMARRARKQEMDLDDFEEFLVPSEPYIGESRSKGGVGDDSKDNGVYEDKAEMSEETTSKQDLQEMNGVKKRVKKPTKDKASSKSSHKKRKGKKKRALPKSKSLSENQVS